MLKSNNYIQSNGIINFFLEYFFSNQANESSPRLIPNVAPESSPQLIPYKYLKKGRSHP